MTKQLGINTLWLHQDQQHYQKVHCKTDPGAPYWIFQRYVHSMTELRDALNMRDYDLIFVDSNIWFTRYSRKPRLCTSAQTAGLICGWWERRKNSHNVEKSLGEKAKPPLKPPTILIRHENYEETEQWLSPLLHTGIPWAYCSQKEKKKPLFWFTDFLDAKKGKGTEDAIVVHSD